MDKQKKARLIPGTLPNGEPDERPLASLEDPALPEDKEDKYDGVPEDDLIQTPPYEPPGAGEGP